MIVQQNILGDGLRLLMGPGDGLRVSPDLVVLGGVVIAKGAKAVVPVKRHPGTEGTTWEVRR